MTIRAICLGMGRGGGIASQLATPSRGIPYLTYRTVLSGRQMVNIELNRERSIDRGPTFRHTDMLFDPLRDIVIA